MKYLSLLCASAFFLSGICQSQERAPFSLQKLSSFKTERERYTYIYDLAESGVLGKTKWAELKPFFDLGCIEDIKENGATVVVHLLEQLPERPRVSPDDIGSRAYLGWRVVFWFRKDGGVDTFEISKHYK